MNWSIYFSGLAAMAVFAFAGWLLSLYRNNVTHVDSMWSLFFMVAAFSFSASIHHSGQGLSQRTLLVLILLCIWALRLCLYLTWRNWGPHEDHRYAAIRKNNEPHFKFTSIYIVFGLQAVLAWVVSLSLLGAITSNAPLNGADAAGALLMISGLIWETVADYQLSRFKNNPANHGKVLNQGLWRFSRHPNYFGECCVWWGFYLMALAGGAWWSVPSALLMTLLLLKISGVALLEKDIAERRPDYIEYLKSTNRFIPWLPKDKDQ